MPKLKPLNDDDKKIMEARVNNISKISVIEWRKSDFFHFDSSDNAIRLVLSVRYGLFDEVEPHSIKETAEMTGYSESYVSKIVSQFGT